MNKTCIIFFIVILFCQDDSDSTSKFMIHKNKSTFQYPHPKLKLNIPGIIPKETPVLNEYILFPHEIEDIKNKAKDFIPSEVTKNDIVILETSRGTIKLKLFSDVAPKHCLNFKKLANSGFYDRTAFHRIIPGFMIQGGDINSRDNDPLNDGQGNPGWTIDAEFNNIPHNRGILSMARSSNQNSAGSQFFICVADAPHLDGKYTVFGKVIENVSVVDRIVNTPTKYDIAVKMSKQMIPEGEDPDNWITLRDPKNGSILYSKVPELKKKTVHEYEMKNRIRSDSPSLKIEIIKLRVVDSTIINNENK